MKPSIMMKQLTPKDYYRMIRRRWWMIAGAAVAGGALAFGASMLLANQYTSQTLVLVEQQRVPDAFVKPIVTEELNQRLSTMQEQILSRTKLEPIIDGYGLFTKDRGKVPMEDLVDRMRRMVTVRAVRADFGTTEHPGVPGFYVTFTADDPHLAQQVCSRITSMFIDENLKAREQSAIGTTDFLASQVENAKRSLDEQDAKLAQFKRQHIGQLPEQEQTNLSMLGTLNTQLEGVNQALSRAEQDQTYINSMITEQAEAWKTAQKSGVVKTESLEDQLERKNAQLIDLESKYTPSHPDVLKLKSEIQQLKSMMSGKSTRNREADDAPSTAEPQALQQLRLQAHLADQTVREKSKQQQELQKQIAAYQQRIQMTPAVEEQYKALTRDYQEALSFYNDLLSKKSQSQVSSDMERRQEGERFRVMDAANVPEKPTWPNRPLFAGGGFGAGLALGLGLALLLELLDSSLHNEDDVARYLELPTVITLPDLDSVAQRLNTENEKGSRVKRGPVAVGG